MQLNWSDMAKRTKGSDIRKLLKLTQDPGMISFGGGMPGPEAFPKEDELIELFNYSYDKYGTKMLQYGLAGGQLELREQIVKLMAKKGVSKLDTDNILITSGGQQALDLINRSLINPGSRIALGAPTYLAYWQSAAAFGAVADPVIRVDKDGLEVGLLEDELYDLYKKKNEKIALAYDVPTFNNPAATTMPFKHRKKFIDIAHEFDFPIIEDDPYSWLRYNGDDIKPLKSLDYDGRVIYLSTFSKTMFPGLRIAWIAADKEIIDKLETVRQPVDLHSNTLGQYIATSFLEQGMFEPHVEHIKECYKKKRDIMMKCMDKYFPKEYDIEYERPEGGLFNWVTLGHGIDSSDMKARTLEMKVGVVFGGSFYADGRRSSSMRINFSYETPERIEIGVERLGKVITERMKYLST
jgi:2-aminoadipate transaminase